MGQYTSGAQNGISKDTRVAKHQLLTDRAVARDCRTRQTNLCTAWIDYKKAYNSMPKNGYWNAWKYQQDTESLYKELNQAMENKSGGQLKASCTSYHEVQHMPSDAYMMHLQCCSA